MKKLLISTSALVAVAGVANAQVTLTGSAEAGFKKGPADNAELLFHTDMDINFRGVGTTDGGLQFGATVDLDEAGTLGNEQGGSPSVFITSTSFGTLTLGDTDGAFDRVLDEVEMLTTIADDHTGHAGRNGNGGLDGNARGVGAGGSNKQVLRYDRQFGIFELAVSYEHPNGKKVAGGTNVDPVWGIGGSVDFGGGDNTSYAVSLGIQGAGENTIFGISGVARFSGVDVRLNYSQLPTHSINDVKLAAKDGTHIGFGIGYSINDFAIAFNYGKFSDGEKDGDSGWGIAINYALSGGAVVQAGLAQSEIGPGDQDGEDLRYSVGLSLNF